MGRATKTAVTYWESAWMGTVKGPYTSVDSSIVLYWRAAKQFGVAVDLSMNLKPYNTFPAGKSGGKWIQINYFVHNTTKQGRGTGKDTSNDASIKKYI